MIPRGLCRPEKRDLPCINAQRPSLDFTLGGMTLGEFDPGGRHYPRYGWTNACKTWPSHVWCNGRNGCGNLVSWTKKHEIFDPFFEHPFVKYFVGQAEHAHHLSQIHQAVTYHSLQIPEVFLWKTAPLSSGTLLRLLHIQLWWHQSHSPGSRLCT